MIRDITNTFILREDTVKLNSHPGVKSFCMCVWLNKVGTLHKTDVNIIHCGTNNNSNETNTLKRLKRLLKEIKENNKKIHLKPSTPPEFN